jgi:hypothetical protein
VASRGGVITFAGTSGNGKSTLAWAMAREDGYHQMADDAVVLDGFDEGRAPVVRPLPFRPRLRQASLQALRRDSRDAPDTIEPRPADPLPLRAVVVLEQDSRHADAPVVTPLSASAAFTAVVTHAYAFDEDDQAERERMTRHYLALVAKVPVLRLRYRPDFDALPRLIGTLVDAIDAGRPTRV